MALTLLQLSDVHFPAEQGALVYGRDAEARLRTVIHAALRALPRIDAVLLTGDQVHEGDVEANRRLRTIVGGLGVPVLAAPGNHDDAASHRTVFGPTGAFELGQWRVITWDSCIDGEDHGYADVAALRRLLDQRDETPTVLAMHHPPVPPTPNPVFRLDDGPELLDALQHYRHVRAVVTGHAHSAFTLSRDGLVLAGGPSVILPFLHKPDGELDFGGGGPTGAQAIFLGDRGKITTQVIAA